MTGSLLLTIVLWLGVVAYLVLTVITSRKAKRLTAELKQYADGPSLTQIVDMADEARAFAVGQREEMLRQGFNETAAEAASVNMMLIAFHHRMHG